LRWLISAFVVVAAYYQANVTQHLDYLHETRCMDYAKYVGQNVTKTGTVSATGAGSFQLKGLYDTYMIFSSHAVQRQDDVPSSVRSSPDASYAWRRCSSRPSCWAFSSMSAPLLRSSLWPCSF
jgi:hypothetical protein